MLNLFIIVVSIEKFSSPFCDDTRPIIFLLFFIFIIRVIIGVLFLIILFKPGKSGRLFILAILFEQWRSGSLNNFIPLDNIILVTLFEQWRSGSLNNFIPLDNIIVVTVFIV